MDRLLRLLATFEPGERVPLHVIGRVLYMEPNRVRPLVQKLIRKRYVDGRISKHWLRNGFITAVPLDREKDGW
jgi:DNA-binding IclR family transcriptional regulator